MRCDLTPTAAACATMPRRYLSRLQASLSRAGAVLFQNAEIHHDEDPGFPRLFGGALVDYLFLHPDGRDFQLDCLIDDLFHEVWPPENIYDVDLSMCIFLRNIEQGRIRLFPEALCNPG